MPHDKSFTQPALFHVEALACRRSQRLIFKELSFSLEAGALLLVMGDNGSGKSSLLRMLAGLLPPAKGDLFWRGENISEDRDAYRSRVHYVGHLDALKPELTVREMLNYWLALRGGEPVIESSDPSMKRVPRCSLPPAGRAGEGGGKLGTLGSKLEPQHQAEPPPPCPSPRGGGNASGKYRSELSAVSIKNLHLLEPFHLTALQDAPVRTLSAGQRRRLSLTRLLIDDAPLWLLDEPTTALDVPRQALLFDALAVHRAKGGIAIIATHQELDLPNAQKLFLAAGKR